MMTSPGFTAEASFRTFRAGFQARTEADVSGGLVHAAGSVFIPQPIYCCRSGCVGLSLTGRG